MDPPVDVGQCGGGVKLETLFMTHELPVFKKYVKPIRRPIPNFHH